MAWVYSLTHVSANSFVKMGPLGANVATEWRWLSAYRGVGGWYCIGCIGCALCVGVGLKYSWALVAA